MRKQACVLCCDTQTATRTSPIYLSRRAFIAHARAGSRASAHLICVVYPKSVRVCLKGLAAAFSTLLPREQQQVHVLSATAEAAFCELAAVLGARIVRANSWLARPACEANVVVVGGINGVQVYDGVRSGGGGAFGRRRSGLLVRECAQLLRERAAAQRALHSERKADDEHRQ